MELNQCSGPICLSFLLKVTRSQGCESANTGCIQTTQILKFICVIFKQLLGRVPSFAYLVLCVHSSNCVRWA